MLVINPKRINESVKIKPYWYNYYAGYSHTFTMGIIDSSGLHESSIILDPWNGSGTTTLMASISGYKSIGIDLNPVMNIIAKAKQATIENVMVAEEHISSLKLTRKQLNLQGDTLKSWFNDSSVALLRLIENNILENNNYQTTNEKIDSLDEAQCLMYTALFNSVREYLKPFISSNPTWVKKPKSDSEKISLDAKIFKNKYLSILRDMVDGIKLVNHAWAKDLCNLVISSSSKIPLEDNFVDLVLTSPPYCTRIDYGIATLPEMALVSVGGEEEIDAIRRSLMGTTTVPKKVDFVTAQLGIECLEFLSLVKNHHSKASKTYYYKNLVQYFTSLCGSIREISRVLKKKGKFVCVVQESFYKDVRCDLPNIVAEMAQFVDLKLVDKFEFESKQNMANVNRKSKIYRGKNTAFETVLILKNGK